MSTEQFPPGDETSKFTKKLNIEYTSAKTPYLTLPTETSTPIYLTPFYPTDASSLQAVLSDTSISSKLIRVPQPYTLAVAEFWVNLQLSSDPSRNLPLQVIRCTHPDSTGTIIGSASLCPLSLPTPGSTTLENVYELGYYLHPDWRGKGIMSAAAKAVVQWGKEAHDANSVIRVAEENVSSRKVVQGMKEWERVESRDAWEDWPEVKGGGRRKLLFWKWKY